MPLMVWPVTTLSSDTGAGQSAKCLPQVLPGSAWLIQVSAWLQKRDWEGHGAEQVWDRCSADDGDEVSTGLRS